MKRGSGNASYLTLPDSRSNRARSLESHCCSNYGHIDGGVSRTYSRKKEEIIADFVNAKHPRVVTQLLTGALPDGPRCQSRWAPRR